VFDDVERALESVPGLVGNGDALLIKASRGARLERLVERLLEEGD
jgi:UDP-N-acetylmuramyl pentapeptide synthase